MFENVVGYFQIRLIQCLRRLIAAIQLAVGCSELYFARCYALKRTGIFTQERLFCVYFH